MQSARALILVACAVFAVPISSATGEPTSERRTHWSVGVGSTLAVTGSDRTGSIADAELYPASTGRLGIRLETRGLGEATPSAFLIGVTFEAAASRPRLVLALYGVAGLDLDARPLLAAGVQTQLYVIGPLAIGLDAGGLLVIDGTADTELRLQSGLLIRLGH